MAEGTEDAEGTNNSTEDKDIATQVKTEAKEEEEAGVEVKKEVKDVENGETVVSPDDSSAEGTGEAGNDKDTPPPEADEINDSINEHNLIDPKVTNQMAPPTQSQIKFNITTKIELERRESVISNSQSDSEESEFDRDGVIHESKLTEEERNNLKPKMAGKKFVVVPPRNTDSDVSGLCSIM